MGKVEKTKYLHKLSDYPVLHLVFSTSPIPLIYLSTILKNPLILKLSSSGVGVGG